MNAELEIGLQLWPVQSSQIESVWPHVASMIMRAMAHADGVLDIQDIKDCCLDMDMQMWLAVSPQGIQGVCITQLVTYPKKKVVRVVALSGSRINDWYGFLDAIERWGRGNGATETEGFAREELARLLERKGWIRKHVVIRKPIM